MAAPQAAAPSNVFGQGSFIQKYSDVMIAVAIITIVVMMIIPLPTLLLDMLICLNITIALLLVMAVIYNKEALDLSIFPSLLLITTLFRLALNISSTRLILLDGYAGEVITAFGNFVVGGNPVVGFIMFVILVAINFIVITKGSERVAEVSARFTLDAMPGKQMSIDADLNQGAITDAEAKIRREKIQHEADFFGAMDGASKFVKGDAIAAILIMFINIAGGFIIGMMQRNLDAAQALQTYTLLTVGEGLVSQIPALLISTATGLIVTRAGAEGNIGSDMVGQLFRNDRIFFILTGVLLFFAIIPGLPGIPFLSLSIACLFIGRLLRQGTEVKAETQKEEKKVQEKKKATTPENIVSLLQVDPMELEIGYSLIPLVDTGQGGDLLDRIVMIRRQCALELGLVVPTIRIRDNIQIKPNAYIIKLKGIEIAKGELMLDHYLAMNSGTVFEEVPGIETTEPAFGLPALWIPENEREQAELNGYTVVDAVSVLATHLTEVIKQHADEILGRQETQNLVDNLKKTNQALVDEVVPDLMSVGEIQKVLANLLRERISIRDMATILEVLSDYARATKDTEILTEYVRHAMARQITQQNVQNGTLPCITLDPALENRIAGGVQRTDHGSYVSLDPDSLQNLVNALNNELPKLTNMGYQPIVLTSPAVRLYFRKLVERSVPGLIVLSQAEIEQSVEIQILGVVKI
ncbi:MULTISPECIES: flagellar biosynthesis protein FlhA [Selenomonas]|uniref:Flagellar biosynthesis protein FlhA n=1 Tax=Selenomonas ruminis TaxID=2593411 RepID=A0A5D6W958_9FIRM|nr:MULTISPECIES: flagellar biosynthesis protein FlhA [unclassified Selenomonas]MBQ1867380.1 flagellar biosynthesis protein FlhA [Selenomonas sp.]TYZ23499.1 flagellar biosynthesis protein FlhA [Selenomonas sp. mPRGC5]SDG37149.1 flagellar biosynthesis protein FlhA [Selenomonas ruminantium]